MASSSYDFLQKGKQWSLQTRERWKETVLKAKTRTNHFFSSTIDRQRQHHNETHHPDIHRWIYMKNKKSTSKHTGAMYSSVPTKEFDALTGSAINIGDCWPLWCLFFAFASGIKSCTKHNKLIQFLIPLNTTSFISTASNRVRRLKSWHTWGLQDVKQDKSKSVKDTWPLLWSKTFSGFKSL